MPRGRALQSSCYLKQHAPDEPPPSPCRQEEFVQEHTSSVGDINHRNASAHSLRSSFDCQFFMRVMRVSLPGKLVIASMGLQSAAMCKCIAASVRESIYALIQIVWPLVQCITDVSTADYPRILNPIALACTCRFVGLSYEEPRLISIPVQVPCLVYGVVSFEYFLIVVGTNKTLHRFDIETRKWSELSQDFYCSISCEWRNTEGSSLGGLRNRIYFFGGSFAPDQRWKTQSRAGIETVQLVDSARTFCFDLKSLRWEALPAMQHARTKTAASCVSSSFFIVGGKAESGCSRIVERYDSVARRWFQLPDMPTARSNCTLLGFENIIFALGGLDQNSARMQTVEKFDLRHCIWECLPTLQSPRCHLGATVTGTKLFVIGGAAQPHDKEVEVLDLQGGDARWLDGPWLPFSTKAVNATELRLLNDTRFLWASDL